jgi:hypothetical protein
MLPFSSKLIFHGVEITVQGKRRINLDEGDHAQALLFNEVSFQDGGLFIGLEDLVDGKIFLNLTKNESSSDVIATADRGIVAEVSPDADGARFKRANSGYLEGGAACLPAVTPASKRGKVIEELSGCGSVDSCDFHGNDETGFDDINDGGSCERWMSPLAADRAPRRVSNTQLGPPARWGHSMTRISGERLVVYGGQSEEDPTTGCDVTLGDL